MRTISAKKNLVAITFALVLVPLLAPAYIQGVMTKFIIYTAFAISLNILLGYMGYLSLGHAAFFGTAGYTVAILVTRYGIKSFYLTASAGVLAASILGAIFGAVALRVYGLYFLIITFALGQLVFAVAYNWHSLTGGFHGLSGIGPPEIGFVQLTSDLGFYYFCLVCAAGVSYLFYRIVNSPFGLVIECVRESESRARALGYNVWLHKYISFILSAAGSGFSGVLFTYWMGHIGPGQVGVMMSTLPVLFIILGSSDMFLGPVVGAGTITSIEYVASIYMPERWPLILGCILIVAVMVFPKGIGRYLASSDFTGMREASDH